VGFEQLRVWVSKYRPLGIILADKRLLGTPLREEALILHYHSIPKDQRMKSARQMDILLRWASPVRADFETLPEEQGRLVYRRCIQEITRLPLRSRSG
jgi:hypothetical protein